jgi:L-phenylalanine/L-methionine N-acetyltransferase
MQKACRGMFTMARAILVTSGGVGHSWLSPYHGLRHHFFMPDLAIQVRRARPSDAAAFARIMSHPEVYPGLLQLPMNDEAFWRTRLETSTAAGSNVLSLVAERAGQVVGTAGLHPAAELRRRHCGHIGISVDPHAQRLGVASALMQAMCDYADQWAQIWRIELTVFTDNLGAIALYEKFGFGIEGTHRAYAMRHGAYADVHAMARLRAQPPVLRVTT